MTVFNENINFKKYFFASNISKIGDILHSLVIMALLLNQNNATQIMSIIVSTNAIVRVLFSFFLAKFMDKLNAKKTMIYLDVSYGVAMLLMAVLLICRFNVWYLVIFEFLFSVIALIYKISKEKLLKDVLLHSQKNKGISLLFTTENILIVLIPSVASLFLGMINPYVFIFINVTSFFISARITQKIEYTAEISDTPLKLEDGSENSLRTCLKKYPELSIILISSGVLTFIFSTSNVLMLHYINVYCTQNESQYIGVFKSCFAVGCIIGAFSLKYMRGHAVKEIKTFSFIGGLLFIPFVVDQNRVTFMISILLLGLVFSILNGIVQIYYQSSIDRENLGFLRSWHTIIVGVLIPISMYINGYILEHYSLKLVYIFFMSICFTLMLLIAFKEKYSKLKNEKELLTDTMGS